MFLNKMIFIYSYNLKIVLEAVNLIIFDCKCEDNNGLKLLMNFLNRM